MTPPVSVSAAWPINLAIAAAIELARAQAVAGFDKLDDPPVYSGLVPENTPLVSAYIVLANSQETVAPGAFRRRGRENLETIDVWTADTSKATALAIAGALVALLDGRPLDCPGYGIVRGRCEIPLTLADPSTRQYRAQLRYTATSLNPVPA